MKNGEILFKLEELNQKLINQLKTTKETDYARHFEIAKAYQHLKLDAFDQIDYGLNQSFLPFDTNSYFKALSELLNSQQKTKVLVQKKARFYPHNGDPWQIKVIKTVKRFSFQISTVPRKTQNAILKLFGKKTKYIGYWKHKVPYRKVVELHTKRHLTVELKLALDHFIRKEISIVRDALATEQKLNDQLIAWTLNEKGSRIKPMALKCNIEDYLKRSKENLSELKSALKDKVEHCYSDINETTELAGTLELPGLMLRYLNRKRKKHAIRKSLSSMIIGWGNTMFALFEDWDLDQEIYNLNYFTRQKTQQVIFENERHIREELEILESTQQSLADFSALIKRRLAGNHARGKHIIKQAIEEIRHGDYIRMLDQAIEKSISFNSPQRIDQFELKVSNFLKEIAHKRWLTSLTDYVKPLNASELSSFSPRELIGFEYLPKLSDSCSKLKARLTKEIETSRIEIENLEHIIAFNLSSVIDSLEKKECTPEELPALVDEGLERAKKKLGDITKTMEDVYVEIADELSNFTQSFIDSNLKLTNNENAFNLRMIVMRAKALKKSEEFGVRFLKRFWLLYRFSRIKSKILFRQLEKTLLPWKKRIGLEAESGIATALSDFLYEAYRKINNLPIIYQRLYKIMPLTEMNLFMGRQKEVAALQQAFISWQESNYAPTVVIGEKWSGQTTLINYFLENEAPKHKLTRIELNKNIWNFDDLLALLQKHLKDENIKSEEDIIQKLRNKYQGQIFILENLQNYYLRQIHGFEALNALIRIISKTAKNVFWLCSSNIYAWRYLNKTINIAGYFGHSIEILPFTNDELRKIIMKKNNISGYKIIFAASEKTLSSKNFLKKSEDDQQLYLRDKFFNDLNSFAKGNISLALSFWLLSTSNITDDSIEITSFSPPDFSFIKGLSTEIVFIIYQIIMHDGLRAREILMILNQPESSLDMKLSMLYDDGILITKDEQYQLNPLIYRHTINMLKSKNLIY